MENTLLSRLLTLPERSFFLFGPRSAGKSTYLRQVLPQAIFLDLLDSAIYLELSQAPHHLEAMIGNRPAQTWVVLDEVQKIPALLNEVHRLIENKRWRFVLCGSSARKLRRGGTNLLAGRAITRHMEAFSSAELGTLFDLHFSLQYGLLPTVQLDRKYARDILDAYVNTYIKEEIREEGLVRNLAPFLRFLGIAGQINAQQINAQNLARDAAVSRSNIDSYFSILEDTLLGHKLSAYRPNIKVREQTRPKFYWFDPGVARAAAGLLDEPLDRIWLGLALETLIYHELRVYNHTREKHRPIGFYRTAMGGEIDFIIETRKRTSASPARVVCIEVKLSDRWDRRWERQMRDMSQSPKIQVDRMIGIYTGEQPYHFDGVDVLPVTAFLQHLHQGQIF